jgi:RsiW-degrading membrane proteinase PrsW (M82 family)
VFALLRLEPTVRDRLDGTLGAISVGLGFASLESALYVSQLGEAVLLTRACTAVLAHSAFTGIAGYYLGLAREEGRFRAILVLKGLALAVLLHGAYDALLAWSGPSSIVAILLGVMVLITLAGALALLHGHLRMATEWSRIRRLLKL